MNFNNLPPEVQLEILKNTDVYTLLNMGKTCTYYRHIYTSQYNYVWKSMTTVYNIETLQQFNTIHNSSYTTWFQICIHHELLDIIDNDDIVNYIFIYAKSKINSINYAHTEQCN